MLFLSKRVFRNVTSVQVLNHIRNGFFLADINGLGQHGFEIDQISGVCLKTFGKSDSLVHLEIIFFQFLLFSCVFRDKICWTKM